MRRVSSTSREKEKAEPTTSSASGWNAAVPGRTMINAPMKPTMTAAQRRAPTVSPRTGLARAVTNSGAVKATAMTSASGRLCKASKNSNNATNRSPARSAWVPSRRVRSALRPPLRQTKTATGSSPKT